MRIVLILVLLCCVGCGPLLMATVAKPVHNPERFKNRIYIGMTQDEVRGNWEKPDKIIKKSNKKYDEVWVYKPHWKIKN